jgi:hypothetical protein
MKDALGHGSDAGAHAQAIAKLPAKMGRRHFEQLAEQLRAQGQTDPAGHDARVNAMADHLATTNPGFRRDLFVKASQPGTSYKNKSTRAITRGNAARQLKTWTNLSGYSGPGAQSPRVKD